LHLHELLMKSVNHTKSTVSILVVFLLLASIVCSALGSFSAYPNAHEITVTKKTNAQAKSNALLLYEEKEGENKSKDHSSDDLSKKNLYLIRLIVAPILPRIASQQCFSATVPLSFGSTTGFPLYLAKRALLI
jgi:hypothetical protein